MLPATNLRSPLSETHCSTAALTAALQHSLQHCSTHCSTAALGLKVINVIIINVLNNAARWELYYFKFIIEVVLNDVGRTYI